MEKGILYVVFNDNFRNPKTNEMIYKIGITKNSVHIRFEGLKMPGKLEMLFAYKMENYKKTEQMLHWILRDYQNNGEWYNLTQKELDLIRQNCEAAGGIPVNSEYEKANDEEKSKRKTRPLVNNICTGKEVNPTIPCKIFMFPIGKLLDERGSFYEATRQHWKITPEYRDVDEYQFAVGLVRGISFCSYKIKKWEPSKQYKGKWVFEGEEIDEFTGVSFQRQIDVNKGYYMLGNHFVAEFDGKGKDGKFRLIRPHSDQWIDCL